MTRSESPTILATYCKKKKKIEHVFPKYALSHSAPSLIKVNLEKIYIYCYFFVKLAIILKTFLNFRIKDLKQFLEHYTLPTHLMC